MLPLLHCVTASVHAVAATGRHRRSAVAYDWLYPSCLLMGRQCSSLTDDRRRDNCNRRPTQLSLRPLATEIARPPGGRVSVGAVAASWLQGTACRQRPTWRHHGVEADMHWVGLKVDVGNNRRHVIFRSGPFFLLWHSVAALLFRVMRLVCRTACNIAIIF